MVTDPPRPARARSAEEKSQRREDILKAAERLWTTTPYADLSMNQVAREAKLAKGTLYLYFDTKEELFLALLGQHLKTWIASVCRRLEEQRPKTPTQVADVLLSSTEDLAPMRRLLVLLGTVLERNVRPELAAEFEALTKQQVERLILLLPFQPSTSMRLLRHMYALAIGWQQLSEDTPSAAQTASVRHVGSAHQARPAAPAAKGESGELWSQWRQPFYVDFELALRAVIASLAAQDAQ